MKEKGKLIGSPQQNRDEVSMSFPVFGKLLERLFAAEKRVQELEAEPKATNEG